MVSTRGSYSNPAITIEEGGMDASALNRVYVVEDSPIILAALTQRIEDDPRFTVVGHADTAHGAIGELSQSMPDVLIVDLHLKQGTGYEILIYLRNAGKPALKTIVLTNYASVAHRRRAMELGADSFFDKSMQFDEMLDTLHFWADEKAKGSPQTPPH